MNVRFTREIKRKKEKIRMINEGQKVQNLQN